MASFRGTSTSLPIFIVYRPLLCQLVVAVSGTSSIKHALQDLRVLRCSHPSGHGTVHTGFWNLYQDIKAQAITEIQKGIADHPVREVVLTGHSMGGSIAYLLCLDLLVDHQMWLKNLNINIKMAVFGSPRAGDVALVEYFRELSASYQKTHVQGQEAFEEYSVKGYNDGKTIYPASRCIFLVMTISLQQAYQHFHQRVWVIVIFARNLCTQQGVFCITLLPPNQNTVYST